MASPLFAARQLSHRAGRAFAFRPAVSFSVRCLSIRRRVEDPGPIPPAHTLDTVKPPSYWSDPGPEDPEPMAYVRKPVTSAHAIDLSASPPRLSSLDVASLSPKGTVLHGRYGELKGEVLESIPLEYLALLHPAAEAAAAIRSLSKGRSNGTLLVYGASQAAGIAAVQLGTASNLAVVGVVDGQHSGNREMLGTIKNLASYPGTAVPEEYALVKQNFKELVLKTVHGESYPKYNADADFLPDFKHNLLDYLVAFPEGRSAVAPEEYQFRGKEKDREHFQDNIEAYLEQFPRGGPNIPKADLEAKFTKESYAVWKSKFCEATSSLISGEEVHEFEPPQLARELVYNPQKPEAQRNDSDMDFIPYEFSVLEQQNYGKGGQPSSGGPIAGAVIVATPALVNASAAVEKAGKSKRARAEALTLLTETEKNAYAAARSVAALAHAAGADILVVGGKLPGLKSASATEEDVKAALAAMALEDDGSSKLNFFIQVYRAGDFPVYANYAIHRASEAMAGPRQIVVTK